ncbi:putative MscS family protein [Iodidimonas muriae]|uniref:MscS family protein n=1 Tax=Iodidimonas muriae TaxID=261467 RepID=A0ABQ2L5Q1_9PROT|nr:mechanosensitive ion channel family protein [Iodidimonas muriae]GGO04209.1 putative MscS family protein [Iodidimonas muriae]
MEIASFQDFWTLVVDVWKNGLFGIPLSNGLIALGIFTLFMLFRNLMTRFVLATIKRAATRTKTDIDDRVVEAITDPIRFIPVVMGVFFATSVLDMSADMTAFFYNLNRSLVAFTLFWILYRAATPMGTVLKNAPRGFLTSAMVEWLVKAAKIAFFLLGAATILELWGIAVGPIIAGLGLFGVAVALGAQDLFKNLIAGLFVIGEKRFFTGDWIQVDGVVEGTVEHIGFRTTMVRRFDKAPVFVPNSKLSDNAVTNFQRMTHRRIKWIIGVEYRTTKEQLRTIRDAIEAAILENDDFAHPPEVPTFVRIDAFSDSSIDILLYCFTRTTNWGEWLAIKEKLALQIKDIVEGAGTGFAFPSRSLYLETLPDAPEPFPLSLQKQADAGDASAPASAPNTPRT